MDEATKSEMAAILKALRESAGKVEGFVLEQAPGVVREMVVYGRAYYAVGLILSVAYVAAIVQLFRKLWSRNLIGFKDEDQGALTGLVFCIALIFSIPGLATVFPACSGLLLTWFAPRVYVLQQVADYLK